MGNVSPQCRRCGTCCKKGGPALHAKDRSLVESGRIPLKDLYTLRRGEWVRDDVRGTLQPLKEEIIKIKVRRAGHRACRYYVDRDGACSVYAFRPSECRALQCWDTRKIERIYSVERLQRKDLIGQVKGLWDLVEDHDRRCCYERLHRLVRRLKDRRSESVVDKVLEMLRYDAELRNLVIEKARVDPGMLEFLFGRPLAETAGQFGIRFRRQGRNIRLILCGS